MKIEKTVELFDFTKEEFKRFNGKSGVYGLVYDNEVIYVGQSKKLNERLKAHSKEGKVEETIKLIIKEDGKCNRSKQLAMYNFIDKHREDMQFIVLIETDELNKYEEHYIKLFQPKYNYKGVDIPY